MTNLIFILLCVLGMFTAYMLGRLHENMKIIREIDDCMMRVQAMLDCSKARIAKEEGEEI